MNRAAVISHGVLLFATAVTSITYHHSSLLGRPNQSAILLLFFAGLSFSFFRNRISHFFLANETARRGSTLLLQDTSEQHRASDSLFAKQPDSAKPFSARYRRLFSIIVAVAISLRIHLFSLNLSNRQCVLSNTNGYAPLILALYDYWHQQRRRFDSSNLPEGTADPSASHVTLSHRGRSVLPAICLSLANAIQTPGIAAQRSTYICPLSLHVRASTFLRECLGVLLDCYILVNVHKISNAPNEEGVPKDGVALAALGQIFLLSSAITASGGLIAYTVNSVYWVELSDIGWSYAGSIMWNSAGFTVVVLAALHVSLNYGPLHLSMFVLSVCIYTTGISHAWTDTQLLPAPSPVLTIALVLLFFVSVVSYLRIISLSGSRSRPTAKHLAPQGPVFIYAIVTIMVVLLGWCQLPPPIATMTTHPIETLMNEASGQAKDWLDQASRSETLAETVEEYLRRYQRFPPPGFDAWYRFATERSSVVIDDYDSIMEDLKPFWGLSPTRIRELTQEVISDPWNEVSEVKVRNGHARLGPNFIPTHRWMLDGVVTMVKGFSQFLPDMDIAFNLNDEPRVAVPFWELQKLRAALPPEHVIKHRWSPNRAKTWETPEDSQPLRLFADHSRTNAFDEGSLACSPDSYAHQAHIWDSSTLCISCAAPHSHGVFVSNWTLSASPCHQPDLRHLHGFYLSPAAFKPAHQLLPIFSQSKAEGYADILYPSPWNYMDKIRYGPNADAYPDVPFAQKENSLFWRGATSEGVSRAGTWKGMTRQRFVHLANNLTIDSYSPSIPLLLPHPSVAGTFTYQTLTSNPISALNLNLNVSIVGGIARAWDNDGAAQDAEFRFAPSIDFQDHWRYRYLFDMDGAGFSGRFLPFLQSHSLPFRTGIFRSWWDGRLTAWKHFVPVDVRLHGLFSTLAYFMGAASPTGTVEGIMKENLAAGEEIAEAGRLWSQKVLRKEDMEIYMFRLLLEWGRLTDDNRDEIGFMV